VGNVLATLRTLEVWRLGSVLKVPTTKREELKGLSKSDEEWRKRMVQYFLLTHPQAGWVWLGGGLLWHNEYAAVEEVMVDIEPDEGMYVETVIHVQYHVEKSNVLALITTGLCGIPYSM
jgi:hypothetical protein